MNQFQEAAEKFRADFARLHGEISRVIVGNERIIEDVLVSLFSGGHCLLEGVPGRGKTLLISTLSQALDLKFSRIQFTPDLMPSDITGTHIINEDADGRRAFVFERGPVFANVILADEINRATPKTQSALLEAMQEKMVTVGNTHSVLDPPFFVMATQNPLEQEGTYPLPEAQLDRFFFKILLGTPGRADMAKILERTTGKDVPTASRIMDKATVLGWMGVARQVVVAEHVQDYAVRIVLATHPTSEFATELVKKYVRYGASPRGAQTLILSGKIRALLEGRFNVGFSDIERSLLPALRHRVILNFEAEADGVDTDRVLATFAREVPRQMAAATA